MSWTGEDSSDKDRSFAAIIGFDAVLYLSVKVYEKIRTIESSIERFRSGLLLSNPNHWTGEEPDPEKRLCFDNLISIFSRIIV